MDIIKKISIVLVGVMSFGIFAAAPVPAEKSLASSVLSPSVAEAKYNAKKMRRFGKELVTQTDVHLYQGGSNVLAKNHPDGAILAVIQDRLVKYNPRVLNYKGDGKDDWLQPIYLGLGDRNDAYELGGYIVVAKTRIAENSAYYSNPFAGRLGERIRPIGGGYLMPEANLAVLVAHEISHWKLQHTGTGTKEKEKAADLYALQLLDNAPMYSSGAMIPYYMRLERAGFKGDEAHLPAIDLIEEVQKHISNLSNGRVVLDDNFRLSIDGKLLETKATVTKRSPAEKVGMEDMHGRFPFGEFSDSLERTAFFAANVAWCMKNGYWKKEHIDMVPKSLITGTRTNNDRGVFLVAKKDPTKPVGLHYENVAKVLIDADTPKKYLINPELAYATKDPVLIETMEIENEMLLAVVHLLW